MRDTPGLSGINSSDGISLTLIGPHVNENNAKFLFLKQLVKINSRIIQQVCHNDEVQTKGIFYDALIIAFTLRIVFSEKAAADY